ncbi:uncharacterized protein LOC111246773 [Varroa destructor]|uniref:C2H2-type domain-containing protein n=1 Tax=Varroa destructor TaxID=109461 RepID=A0A7M7JIZ2_VARDE|nr:uncharacterized protein LOC111246773 [Varroa destructor]XP_022652672.1 uncharacterized protein LOC111246773 [Varroa destructor]
MADAEGVSTERASAAAAAAKKDTDDKDASGKKTAKKSEGGGGDEDVEDPDGGVAVTVLDIPENNKGDRTQSKEKKSAEANKDAEESMEPDEAGETETKKDSFAASGSKANTKPNSEPEAGGTNDTSKDKPSVKEDSASSETKVTDESLSDKKATTTAVFDSKTEKTAVVVALTSKEGGLEDKLPAIAGPKVDESKKTPEPPPDDEDTIDNGQEEKEEHKDLSGTKKLAGEPMEIDSEAALATTTNFEEPQSAINHENEVEEEVNKQRQVSTAATASSERNEVDSNKTRMKMADDREDKATVKEEQASKTVDVKTEDENKEAVVIKDEMTTKREESKAAAKDNEAKQSTDSPSGSPRSSRRSSGATPSKAATPPSDSGTGSSEHRKMRGRLQKELRKLGVDVDLKDEDTGEEDDKSAVRSSRRSAARLAARKITNTVVKSNLSVETLAAMAASDGEDYSGDGISSKIAQRKASPTKRPRLTYCTTPKALIDNDLMMECAEEALTPCQIDAFRTAVHSYNSITNQIHQLSKRKLQLAFDNRPLTTAEYESIMNRKNNTNITANNTNSAGASRLSAAQHDGSGGVVRRQDDEHYRLETVTSKVCRGAWNYVTVLPLGSEQLRPSIVMTQSAPFSELEDEGEAEMTQLEEEFAIHQLDTDPVPFMVKHRFLTPRGGARSRHYACECNADAEATKADGALDGYVWRCKKCEHTWNVLRPEQTLLSWYAKVPLYTFLNVIKSWVLAHSCEEAAQLTGVDTFIVRSIWRSIQELCHKDVVKRVLPLGTGGEIVEVSAAHMDPFVVLAAIDRKTNTFRAKVFPAVTTSEVDLARAACAWIARDGLITTRSPVMRSALIAEQASLRAPPVLTETPTLDNLLLIHLSDHFGNFRLESAHKPILEGFLYEIEWRRAFGRFGPRECFWRMIAQLLPTSRQGVSFLLQVASQFVTPGGQIPLGVRLPLSERRDSDDDVTVVGEEEEETVILENYYYARRDGERHVPKHKKYIADGEMFFRCPVCKKVAKNNISIMKHISMHLESNREFNPDIGHLSICRYCFRDLETPYHCQIHVQQVHLVSLEAERLCCKICSLAFSDEAQLVYHMKSTHCARDMPFVCKICHFRSSFKHHVIDHFRERHSGCNALQCPFCLDLYYCQARQVVTGVQGTTKFYSHLFKHMNNTPRTCSQCSLPFIKQKDLRAHREECHGKGLAGKGKVNGCGWSSEKPVLVHQPRKKPHLPPAKEGESIEIADDEKPDAPVNWLVPSLRLPEDVEDFDCRECQRPITEDHFVRVLRCTECHFFTCCQSSFTGHMLKMHAQRGRPVPKFIVSTPLLDNKHAPEKFIGRCKKCDEKFEDGNSLVKHLVLECGVEEGASIELGKRKAAVKQIQQVQATSGATSAKRKRGADFEPEPAQPSGSGFTSNAGSGKKFEDVVGEPFTEVFNTSSSNSVGSTPVKTSVPKQAKGNKANVNPELERFLSQLGLRSSESCSDFKVSLTGPKCVKQQWINMGLVQQEIESSSESEDENEDPTKKEKREKARKERAHGLLPPKAKPAPSGGLAKDAKNGKDSVDDLGAADSPPSSSSSSDTSVTDVDLD